MLWAYECSQSCSTCSSGQGQWAEAAHAPLSLNQHCPKLTNILCNRVGEFDKIQKIRYDMTAESREAPEALAIAAVQRTYTRIQYSSFTGLQWTGCAI
jgi:hypothetical protein